MYPSVLDEKLSLYNHSFLSNDTFNKFTGLRIETAQSRTSVQSGNGKAGKGCLLNRCGHCYNHGNKLDSHNKNTGGKTEAALVFYYDAFNCC